MDMFFLRGVSGSGKSELANKLALIPDTVVVSADSYFYDGEGNYNFDVKKLGEAHKQCQEMAKFALENGMNVVVSNTNCRTQDVGLYSKIALETESTFTSIVVENRHGNVDVHNVPEESLLRQELTLRQSLKLR